MAKIRIADLYIFNGLNDQTIVSICQQIFPNDNIVDTNFKIDDEKIDLIRYSKVYNDNMLVFEVKNIHNNALKQYDGLINKYTELKNKIENNPNYVDEVKYIDQIITKIKNEKDEYKKDIDKFQVDKHDDLFMSKSSGKVSDKIFNAVNTLESTADTIINGRNNYMDLKLKKLYRNKDIIEKRSKSNNIIVKGWNKIKLKHISKRLDRLQKKSGRMHGSQRRIASSNAEYYVSILDRKFKEYYKDYNKIENIINQKTIIEEQIANNQLNISENETEIANLRNMPTVGLNGIINVSNSMKLKNENEKFRREIDRLQSKQGKLNFANMVKNIDEVSFTR